MKKITIAFDIDWTLREGLDDNEGNPLYAKPREEIRSLLIMLSSFKNIECHIWSGGGETYAKDIRRLFLLEKYVLESNCHSKMWDFRPDIAIDDLDIDLGKINLIVGD